MKFTLKNGTQVESPSGSYTVESWNAGKWNIEEVFSGTKDGYEEAQWYASCLKGYYKNVRIQQWF